MHRRIRRSFLLLTIGLACAPHPGSSQAAPDWSFSGTIIDGETGRPVSGAQVYIGSLDVGVLSRMDGSFTLPISGADSVIVRIERIGYCAWQRFVRQPAPDSIPPIQLYPQSLDLDGFPTFSVSAWPRSVVRPASSWSIGCLLEQQVHRTGLELSVGDPIPWEVPLHSIAEAALRHPDVIAIGNRVRGDQPLLVALDDSSLEGGVVADAPLPHGFARAESALLSLARGNVPAIALLALRGFSPDLLDIWVHFENDYATWADRLPIVRLRVVRVQGEWLAEQP
jgi:hypothetical protein